MEFLCSYEGQKLQYLHTSIRMKIVIITHFLGAKRAILMHFLGAKMVIFTHFLGAKMVILCAF